MNDDRIKKLEEQLWIACMALVEVSGSGRTSFQWKEWVENTHKNGKASPYAKKESDDGR